MNEIISVKNLEKSYKENKVIKGICFSRETQIQFRLKAADILRKLGDYSQSIEQLLQAEEYMEAMKIMLELPQNMTLYSYADRIPEMVIVKNLDFAYQCFFYHYANMEFEKCRRLYEVYKTNMSEDSTFSVFRFSNIFVEDSFCINEIDIMDIEDIAKLPLKETTKALILIKDASFLYTLCRYDDALNFINQAMSCSASTSNLYINFFSFSIKSQILEDMGELNQCEALYEEMDKILRSNRYITMFNTSFYIGNTGVHLKRMSLDSAERCLRSAEEYVADVVTPSIIGYKYNLAEL